VFSNFCFTRFDLFFNSFCFYLSHRTLPLDVFITEHTSRTVNSLLFFLLILLQKSTYKSAYFSRSTGIKVLT
jgi:hypothetical protein